MSDHRAPSAFDAPAMAAGYAAYRPAVHAPVMARAVAHLECSVPVARVLDVGCGAGLSTRAALPWAGSVVGVDPSAAMITAARRAVPAARFAVGAGERLPVGRGTVDVVTAAGSLDVWCVDALAPVLTVARPVEFDAWFAVVRPRAVN